MFALMSAYWFAVYMGTEVGFIRGAFPCREIFEGDASEAMMDEIGQKVRSFMKV